MGRAVPSQLAAISHVSATKAPSGRHLTFGGFANGMACRMERWQDEWGVRRAPGRRRSWGWFPECIRGRPVFSAVGSEEWLFILRRRFSLRSRRVLSCSRRCVRLCRLPTGSEPCPRFPPPPSVRCARRGVLSACTSHYAASFVRASSSSARRRRCRRSRLVVIARRAASDAAAVIVAA